MDLTPPLLTRDLTRDGFSGTELARMNRTGELVHLRRGAWLAAAPDDEAVRHRLLLHATRSLTSDGVVSHGSAAVLHSLPTFGPLTQVHLTRPHGRGKQRGYVHRHVAALEPDEIVACDGAPTTSLARTVVDLARRLPFAEAVATGDAALRLGLEREALEVALARATRRPGIGAARRVVIFADGRSESVGESFSRVTLHRLGLAPSTLQLEVLDLGGRFVARTDFGWEAERVVGEFDGRIKYGRLVGPGQRPEDVLWAEKRREDAVRELNLQMVRWTWGDLQREQVLAARVRRALGRDR